MILQRAGWAAVLALTLVAAACGGGAKKSDKTPGIDHQGGIPVIPRGKVVLAAARGEKFLLEIEAPVSAEQAVAFYRNQLPRERWTGLRIQKVAKGLWGVQARRGMFLLTGRIKRMGRDRTSMGFERKVQRNRQSWKPPVPRDVVVLADAVTWEERVFDAGGSRVEIRGSSLSTPDGLRSRLVAELRQAGWTLPNAKVKSTLVATRKKGEVVRTLKYRLEPQRKGTQVRLQLSLDELAGGARPAPGRTAPAPRDAGTAPGKPATSNLVPVPKDLMLWKDSPPPAARRLSEHILSVTFVRPCKQRAEIRKSVTTRLKKNGYKILPAAVLPGGAGSALGNAVTATRGKRLVVAMVSWDSGSCTVTLTVTRK